MKTLDKNNIIFWVAVPLLVVGLAFVFLFKFNLMPFQSGGESRLVVYLQDGRTRVFQGPVSDDMTVLTALYGSSLGGKFDFKYHMSQEGKTILESLAGQTSPSSGKGWSFYLNKKSIKVEDIDRVHIKTGDLIEAKFE